MGTAIFRLLTALAAAAAALPLALVPAEAAVVEVSSLPARAAVAAGSPASVTVDWQVVRNVVSPPGPGTVSSASLQVMIGGSPVATLQRPLSRSLAGTATMETASFREVVRIPEALVYRAVKQGASLQLVRAFVDSVDGLAETAVLEVTPTGPGSTDLQVDRLALAFDDDSRTRLLAKGGRLRAVAELSTAGVGLVTGQWEVASAATTAGTPVFRPLSLVRQGVAGGGRTVITSPPLPAATEGTHFVRFRVVEPAPTFEAPALPYYVMPAGTGPATAAARAMIISAPRPGEALTAATRFAWTPLEGAEAYRIAFYPTPAGPAAPSGTTTAGATTAGATTTGDPLAGLFVAGERGEAVAAAFTLAQLPGDRSYLWQLLAIDAKGAVVGSSPLREIYKP